MTRRILALVVALGVLAGCASTPQDRGQFHQYLHEHGLE